MKLQRDEFFGHEKIQKLTNQINKRTMSGFLFLIIKDVDLIMILKENKDWLDYIGISVDENNQKETFTISWRDIK